MDDCFDDELFEKLAECQAIVISDLLKPGLDEVHVENVLVLEPQEAGVDAEAALRNCDHEVEHHGSLLDDEVVRPTRAEESDILPSVGVGLLVCNSAYVDEMLEGARLRAEHNAFQVLEINSFTELLEENTALGVALLGASLEIELVLSGVELGETFEVFIVGVSNEQDVDAVSYAVDGGQHFLLVLLVADLLNLSISVGLEKRKDGFLELLLVHSGLLGPSIVEV